MAKKRKEKITYIDDGRTIADMSNVGSGSRLPSRPHYVPRAPFKEQAKTFFGAMKMMFTPMLVVIVAICVLYMILYAIFMFL